MNANELFRECLDWLEENAFEFGIGEPQQRLCSECFAHAANQKDIQHHDYCSTIRLIDMIEKHLKAREII